MRLFHADLYGTRAAKYATLAEQNINDVPWTEIIPNAPSYLFVPQNQDVRAEYELGWSVKDIFPVNSVGIVTGQDKKTIAFTEGEAEQLAAALNINKDAVKPILYRPFDTRFIVYDKSVVTRQRYAVMHNFLSENIALITSRMTKGEEFNHMQITRQIAEVICMSPLTSNNGFVFPLYIHPTASEAAIGIETHPNLAPAFVQALQERTQTQATPEQIFCYVYAILHSPTYRTRYSEFLKRDFPRIPLPHDYDHFRKGEAVGKVLIGTHLLERPNAIHPPIGFPQTGTNTVGKLPAARRYQPGSPDTQTNNSHDQTGRIHLNDTQYWTNIHADVWQFRVGGYQPAAKWLDDRAGRTLSDDDLTHYRKLLIALNQTLLMLPAADEVFARCLGE